VRSHSFAVAPCHHFVPSSGFLDLSTSFSAPGLAGLFHPAATSRIPSRSGASLPAQPPFLIGRTLPPCRCFLDSLTDFRRPPLVEDLGSEAFIRARQRSLQSRYSQFCTPLPSSGSAPPGIDFFRLDPAYPCPPLSTFVRSAFASAFAFAIAARFRPQRLSRMKHRVASPLRAPARAFEPFLQPSVLATPTHRPLPCDELARDFDLRPLGCPRVRISFLPTFDSSVARRAKLFRSTPHRDRFVHDDRSSRPAHATVARLMSLSEELVARFPARLTPPTTLSPRGCATRSVCFATLSPRGCPRREFVFATPSRLRYPADE
jgi:hypothetical protein